MKLHVLAEDDFLTSLRKSIGKAYFSRPGLHTLQPRGASRGIDQGSRAAGFNFLTTGTPRKGRHRRYFSLTPPNAM
jgi:hypothetical protein